MKSFDDCVVNAGCAEHFTLGQKDASNINSGCGWSSYFTSSIKYNGNGLGVITGAVNVYLIYYGMPEPLLAVICRQIN